MRAENKKDWDELSARVGRLEEKLRVAENQEGVAREMMEHAIELKDGALANLKMKEEWCEEWKRVAEGLKASVPAANTLCRELEQAKADRDIRTQERDACYEELTRVKAELESLEKACAKMRDWIHSIRTDCGQDYVHKRDVEPLVEALRRISSFPVHSKAICGEFDMMDIAYKALAQWEKVKEVK